MPEEKVCVNCRIFVRGNECPICHGSNFTTKYKGKLYIIDPNQSVVAKKLNFKLKGAYAIRID